MAKTAKKTGSNPAHHKGLLRLAGSLAAAYPKQTVIVLGSFLVAGFMEGIGAASMLPLLALLNPDSTGQMAEIHSRAHMFFDALGIPLTIATILGFIVALISAKALVSYAAMIQVSRISARIGRDLRLRLIHALLNAKWQHFRNLAVGKSASVIGTEAKRAASVYLNFGKAAADALQVMVYILFALFISWQITLCALVSGGLIMLALKTLVTVSRRAGEQQTTILATLLARVTDALTGVKAIKAMERQKFFEETLARDVEDLEESYRQEFISGQALLIGREPLLAIIVSLGMYISVGTFHVPVAILLVLSFMFLRIVMKLTNVQAGYQRVVSQESGYWTLIEAIAQAENLRETLTPPGARVPKLKQAIRIEHVSFTHQQSAPGLEQFLDEKKELHEDSGKPILNDISMTIPAGKLNVIIGPSGSGKTTLVDMLIGLYTPDSGRIYIDDLPMEQADLAMWRSNIGYLPQEGLLFHDTIIHNVTLGVGNITREDAIKALEQAGALPFIKELPEGVDTIVGERGSRFSGGQRQRIAIARALAGKPQVLLLDEPTSAMDAETEKTFMEQLHQMTSEMTVIAITHNPSVIAYADHVFRVEGGKLLSESAAA
jgi:ATP-binding cassette subfamily C protein